MIESRKLEGRFRCVDIGFDEIDVANICPVLPAVGERTARG